MNRFTHFGEQGFGPGLSTSQIYIEIVFNSLRRATSASGSGTAHMGTEEGSQFIFVWSLRGIS